MLMKNKRPLRSIGVLCSCTVLMLCAYSEQAYGFKVAKTSGGAEIHWPTPRAAYYINTAGFPSASLQAIQAALQTWTNVTTSNFNFVYQAETASTAWGVNDGTNLICFGSLGAGYESTLALNTFWYTAQGQLLDSDIKFNDSFAWATNSSAMAYDVQSIALHELGHALALDDLYAAGDETKIMYYSLSEGQIKRSLQQDDKNGITHLYSSGGSTTTTSTSRPTTTTTPSGTTTTTIAVSCPAEYVLGQDHPDLEQLRAFRDGPLAQSAVGRRLTQIYYNNADSINAALDRNPALRAAVRKFFEAVASLAESRN
jgi:predicted Zn-dependent protease